MNCPHCAVNISEHPASRCLDAWVAEAVMKKPQVAKNLSGKWCFLRNGKFFVVSHYSTDIAAAGEVWDKLADDGWIVSVCWGNGRDGRKYASVQLSIDLFLKADLMNRPITQMDAKALTIPHVLSRASIKAQGDSR